VVAPNVSVLKTRTWHFLHIALAHASRSCLIALGMGYSDALRQSLKRTYLLIDMPNPEVRLYPCTSTQKTNHT